MLGIPVIVYTCFCASVLLRPMTILWIYQLPGAGVVSPRCSRRPWRSQGRPASAAELEEDPACCRRRATHRGGVRQPACMAKAQARRGQFP